MGNRLLDRSQVISKKRMGSKYKKLFVVGCPRSGTSWLTQMIAQHQDVVPAFKESHAYSLIYHPFTYLPKLKLKQRAKSWRWLIRNYGVIPFLMGIKSDHIWQGILRSYKIYQQGNRIGLHFLLDYPQLQQIVAEVRSLPGNDLSKAQEAIEKVFDAFFYRAGGGSEQVFLEKTPMHIRHVDVILRRFPEAKVVEIVRDGRDVYVSHHSLASNESWASRSITKIMGQWKRCVELGERFRHMDEIRERIHLVHYEQLRLNPQEELGKIFQFVDLDYNEELLKEIVNQNDISRVKKKGEGLHVRTGLVGEWRTRLSAREIELCEQMCGDTLRRLGYEI